MPATRPTTALRVIAALLVPIILSGCGNRPTTVTEISPIDSSSIIQSRAYSAVDTFSFSQAKVKYPANDGYHVVPVGSYFLSRIIDRLPAGASKVTLMKFDGTCERTGFALPQVLCRLSAEVTIGGPRGKSVQLSAERNVGSMHAKSVNSISGQMDYGDTTIKGQMQSAVDALVASAVF